MPKCGVTNEPSVAALAWGTAPLCVILEYEHIDGPSLTSHAGLTTVKAMSLIRSRISHHHIASSLFKNVRLERMTSWKATYAGGDWLNKTDDGWMKTSSSIPIAL